LSEKKRKPKAKSPSSSAAAGKSASAGDAGPMNVDFLQQLVNLMSSNDLNTVDLRDSGRRIILKRGAVQQPMMMAAPQQPTYVQQAGQPASTSGGPGASTPPAAPVDESAGLVAIKSPMVGTYYSAPSPDAKPFVAVGSQVDDETDVCVIEAMKVFNNIKAETRGTIAKVMVTNGQTVEFGTVLFLVKPS
jgi:acetyl-CoA carboxylase biotin carboxyl carrier protein